MDFATAIDHLWPCGDRKIPGLRAGITATAPAVLAKHGITSPLVLAHTLIQIIL
jgi:putative chitinase